MRWQKPFKPLAFVFLLAIALWGWQRATTVGLSWDEPYQRHYGEVVYRYLFYQDPALHQDSERLYGPVVPFALTLAEHSLPLSNQDAYVLRHRLTFLIFIGGCGLFFLLASRFFRSHGWGFVAMTCLLLSPVSTSHAFFNTKDIPFMVACIATVLVAYGQRSWKNAAFLGLMAGITTDIRILGILFVPVVLLFFWKTRHAFLIRSLAFLAAYTLAVYAFWPTLWESPFVAFWESLETMSHYPWDGTVLYLGFFEPARHLPWHYLFVWIGISTPLSYVAGFIWGFFGVLFSITNKVIPRLQATPFAFSEGQSTQNAVIPMIWLFFPLGFIVLGNAVLYDAWRHVFFVYPAFILLSVIGFQSLWTRLKHRFQKGILVMILLITWGQGAYFMYQHAPLSYVYFNALAGDTATLHQRFETDYWGLAYRDGLSWVLANDPRPKIRVWMPHFPGDQSIALLPIADQNRLQLSRPEEADYSVTTFRWMPPLPPNPVYENTVGGVPVLRIYRHH